MMLVSHRRAGLERGLKNASFSRLEEEGKAMLIDIASTHSSKECCVYVADKFHGDSSKIKLLGTTLLVLF